MWSDQLARPYCSSQFRQRGQCLIEAEAFRGRILSIFSYNVSVFRGSLARSFLFSIPFPNNHCQWVPKYPKTVVRFFGWEWKWLSLACVSYLRGVCRLPLVKPEVSLPKYSFDLLNGRPGSFWRGRDGSTKGEAQNCECINKRKGIPFVSRAVSQFVPCQFFLRGRCSSPRKWGREEVKCECININDTLPLACHELWIFQSFDPAIFAVYLLPLISLEVEVPLSNDSWLILWKVLFWL